MTPEQTPAQHDAQRAMVLAAERLSPDATERHNAPYRPYPAIKPKPAA